ncbi:hypothetical protein [Microbacterium sp. XT11]|uniref:hypothetical protein n=1 Tax=Microbacterium sp. XT11 TaxID=367477 RepID=UPI00082D05DB|nr:hypothetical protein [Microbacterium sp. XT11]
MKLHYSASAKPGTTWRDASGVQEAACGQRATGRHSGAVLVATSLPEAVTCAKCKALLVS